MTPAEVDAWNKARRAERQADTTLQRAEEQQVERLRYQAGLAERQFNRVDPDNRLVAAELERRWEAALVELRRAEATLVRHTVSGPATVDPDLRDRALAPGRRLPELWADPAVSREHRKALLRCLIDKMVLRRTARDTAAVRIVWRGGEVSEAQVALPVNARAALPRGREMEARVLELARAGVHDPGIVQVLTAEGHRSTRLDPSILPNTVRAIRLRHGIKVAWRCTRWPPVPGWLTVTQAAARLPVPEKWLRKKLREGAIRARLEPSGRWLIPDRPDALEMLRQLRAGEVSQADLLPGVRHKRGHRYA